MSSPEYTQVEKPFLDQLQAMGWAHMEGDTGVPYLTERESFRQFVFLRALRGSFLQASLSPEGQRPGKHRSSRSRQFTTFSARSTGT